MFNEIKSRRNALVVYLCTWASWYTFKIVKCLDILVKIKHISLIPFLSLQTGVKVSLKMLWGKQSSHFTPYNQSWMSIFFIFSLGSILDLPVPVFFCFCLVPVSFCFRDVSASFSVFVLVVLDICQCQFLSVFFLVV